MSTRRQPNHHFLLVSLGAQGQINPARHLARLLSTTTGSRVTIATPVSSHVRMFPHTPDEVEVEVEELISHAAYSDGYDQGFNHYTGDVPHYFSQLSLVGSRTLTLLARSLAARGRPVTRVIYTIFTEWAANVASEIDVPVALFWIQPAAVFTVLHRYFHGGYADLISAHRDDPSFTVPLPGLPCGLTTRDLPTSITDTNSPYLGPVEVLMNALQGVPIILNTFHALEADVIEGIAADGFELVPVGPLAAVVGSTASSSHDSKDLFEHDGSGEYIGWLERREEKSVVYVSFGSLVLFSGEQMEEIRRGLRESGRPYLWVVRRDAREKTQQQPDELRDDERGMVIEWCDQVRVLSHRSVGCFVTHGGWNSTTESVACGVPMVVLPCFSDQLTIAKLIEGLWGVGVRAVEEAKGLEKLTAGAELKRCLDVVMGEGERGEEIRRRAEAWKEKATEAVQLSSRATVSFVERNL